MASSTVLTLERNGNGNYKSEEFKDQRLEMNPRIEIVLVKLVNTSNSCISLTVHAVKCSNLLRTTINGASINYVFMHVQY